MAASFKDPLSIALVITELEVGGAEKCLVYLATRLNHHRFRPSVYSLAGRPVESQLVLQLEKADIPVHFLGARRWWDYWSARRRLGQHLREQQPDIVQTFLFHANLLGLDAAQRYCQAKRLLGIRVADPSRLRLRLEARVARGADRVVCVSRGVADFVQREGRVPADKIDVIPNGIDADAYTNIQPATLDVTTVGLDRLLLLFVGRLEDQKGLDALLPHLPRLFQQLPQHDLVVVGDGSQRDSLQRQADQLGISDRVHFLGRQTNLAGLLRRSELLVLPSRWEGMPNVVLEAMASCRPVVATDAEGVPDLLGPQAEQQMVARGAWQAFIERIVAVCRSESLAASLGRANQVRVAQHFTLEAMLQRYELLYESLFRGESAGEKNPGI
jgi:glycosyltransferase involved in cell wall biosynthesis